MPVIGLSKGDLPEILVHDFRENGYLPEVLLNFFALLGWNPGGDRERMSMEELTSLFSLEGVGKANARFNREKLLAFNTEAAATLPPSRLVAAFKEYLRANSDSPLASASDEQLRRLIEMKKGFRTFREVDEPARFFFVADDQVQFDPAAVEKVLKKQDNEGLRVLRELRPLLAGVEDWTHASLEAAIKNFCEQKQLGLGKVAQPIRVAISGSTISPPIFESLEFLGKKSALSRMDRCITTASA
jgi:glutamyl-tRNA synthetase